MQQQMVSAANRQAGRLSSSSAVLPHRHAGRCTGHIRRQHPAGCTHVAARDTAAAVPDLAQPAPPADSAAHPAAVQDSSDGDAAASACPFLAALPRPPRAQHKWWQRIKQLSDPVAFQPAALGPHSVVEAGAEMLIPGQILVGDGDLAKKVLAGEGDFTQQGAFIPGFGKLIGAENLLSVLEPRHKYLRALIMPALEKQAIEGLIPRMERVLAKHLERWCQESAAGRTITGADACKTMTFDFIINTIMGRDFPDDELDSLIEDYKVWSAGLLDWPFLNLPWNRFGKAFKARDRMIQRLQVDVDRARAQLASGQQPAGILGSFVAAVDEQGNTLTDTQVLDNLLLLLLAGHDTSAITLTNVLAKLQQHPQAMQQLRQEQQQVRSRHGEALSGAVLKDMVYAEAVIRETLRVLPIVPSLSRKASKDFQLGSYLVKEGEFVAPMLLHAANNDPRWVNDDPHAFRPERMMTAEGQKSGWQMPFGHGPRFCAGYAVAMAEMKAFLALLARGYEFSADVNTTWVQRLGRVPVNGLPLTVSRLAEDGSNSSSSS